MTDEITSIRIDGMSCQGCVSNVTGVLGALAGVRSAEVSLEHGSATVRFDPATVSRETLCAAIDDAGFDAR